MKKYLFLLTLAVFMLSWSLAPAQNITETVAAVSGSAEADDVNDLPEESPEQSLPAARSSKEETDPIPTDHLVVGNPTPMRGNFFTNMWGNATTDIDVRTLIHGYNLVMWDGDEGMFAEDPSVVESIVVLENEEHDRSYILTLYDDLYYSDGTKITASDYAFSFLLHIAPEINEIGGTSLKKSYLLGYDEYVSGSLKTLPGVRILSEDTIMITVSHEYLPFFYEMGLLWCYPFPIHLIAPGVEVRDEGDGVFLANIDESLAEPVFTAELLERTILDPETGYQSHPAASCGPYVLSSWDGRTAEFVVNPYFIGDAKGKKPLIRWLTFTVAENDSMVEKLQNGEFGLLNKVVKAETIQSAMELISSGDFSISNYPRIGLSYFSFKMEKPTVSSEAVRQAVAWCIDRNQLIADYTSNFGLRADSYYGLGQWMYNLVSGTLHYPVEMPEDETDLEAQAEYEEELAQWEALTLENLTDYEADVEKANALLDGDGWVRNPDGIREKTIDGETVTLDLKLIYPEGNDLFTSFGMNMVPYLREAGIGLTMEALPMPELLSQFYGQTETDADMIYMASNFDEIFDPSAHFQVNEKGQHSWSFTNGVDEELYELAVDMIRTNPGDTLEYVKKWITFLEHFNKTLPMIPLYTNVYFDFYTSMLQDYVITENVTWGQAIIGASLQEPSEIVPDEENADENVIGESVDSEKIIENEQPRAFS